jgi:hypothetical protein
MDSGMPPKHIYFKYIFTRPCEGWIPNNSIAAVFVSEFWYSNSHNNKADILLRS